MANSLQRYLDLVDTAVQNIQLPAGPANLYEPIRYILRPGGKRIRPVLALMACELFNEDFQKAQNAAVAVELFHNFSLVHDDIMDKAPLRRGEPTVHTRWNENIAILSGDCLLIEAYKLLVAYEPALSQQLLGVFNETATGVCEGQQLDMDFEKSAAVSIDDYLEMIRLKTAVLLGCSLKMGALAGNGSLQDANALYQFGVNLGIAFQLQDDLLDAYADHKKFGKQAGGDILANKKTYLLLTAMADGNANQRTQLEHLQSETDATKKLSGVMDLYAALDVRQKTLDKMNAVYAKALTSLEEIQLSEEKKKPLKDLAGFLMSRES